MMLALDEAATLRGAEEIATSAVRNAEYALARATVLRWVGTIGIGFHPDTDAGDYHPPLCSAEQIAYDNDMEALFELTDDPYALTINVCANLGFVVPA